MHGLDGQVRQVRFDVLAQGRVLVVNGGVLGRR